MQNLVNKLAGSESARIQSLWIRFGSGSGQIQHLRIRYGSGTDRNREVWIRSALVSKHDSLCRVVWSLQRKYGLSMNNFVTELAKSNSRWTKLSGQSSRAFQRAQNEAPQTPRRRRRRRHVGWKWERYPLPSRLGGPAEAS